MKTLSAACSLLAVMLSIGSPGGASAAISGGQCECTWYDDLYNGAISVMGDTCQDAINTLAFILEANDLLGQGTVVCTASALQSGWGRTNADGDVGFEEVSRP